jgi:hypothetical protein
MVVQLPPCAAQPLQFVTVPSGVWQPLATLPLQFAKPVVHAIEHAPPLQLGVPFTVLHV